MAFIVEDGTGLEDANSGASLEDADTYFLERSIAAWTGEDSVKQSALIRATDYVEMRFALRFKGDVEFPDTPQALSFPRLLNSVTTGVPTAYKRALFEYAIRTLNGTPLAPDPVLSTSGLSIVAESHKTGPIDDSFRYASKGVGSVAPTYRRYPAADGLIGPLLKQASGLIR